jgi:hypothetical protein
LDAFLSFLLNIVKPPDIRHFLNHFAKRLRLCLPAVFSCASAFETGSVWREKFSGIMTYIFPFTVPQKTLLLDTVQELMFSSACISHTTSPLPVSQTVKRSFSGSKPITWFPDATIRLTVIRESCRKFYSFCRSAPIFLELKSQAAYRQLFSNAMADIPVPNGGDLKMHWLAPAQVDIYQSQLAFPAPD